MRSVGRASRADATRIGVATQIYMEAVRNARGESRSFFSRSLDSGNPTAWNAFARLFSNRQLR